MCCRGHVRMGLGEPQTPDPGGPNCHEPREPWRDHSAVWSSVRTTAMRNPSHFISYRVRPGRAVGAGMVSVALARATSTGPHRPLIVRSPGAWQGRWPARHEHASGLQPGRCAQHARPRTCAHVSHRHEVLCHVLCHLLCCVVGIGAHLRVIGCETKTARTAKSCGLLLREGPGSA